MSELNSLSPPAPDPSSTPPASQSAFEPARLASSDQVAKDHSPLRALVKPSGLLDDEDLLIDDAMQPEVQSLRKQQQAALTSLAEGHSVNRAALSANVSRATLYRWMKTDPAFMTALHAWRARARRTVRDRLMTIAEKASANLQESVRYGNLGASMAVLRGLGFFNPRRPQARPKPDAPASPSSGSAGPVFSRKLIMELRQLLLAVELPPEKSSAREDVSASPAAQSKLIEHKT